MMNKFLVLLLALSFSFVSTDVSAKKLYKWVDENGQVTYSDQVPPEQIKKEHEELNAHGVVVEKVDDIKTPEEMKAERVEKARLFEEKRQAKKLEKQRLNIIKAYSNEDEIIRLKTERLSALERNIELAKQSLDFQKISREQLLSMAAGNERSGIEISEALKSRIIAVEEKIEYQIKFIRVKKEEMTQVKEKFANDIKVYREATKGN